MIVVGEVFRIPQLAIMVFICFFLSGNDAASTIKSAIMGGGVILLGTGLSIIFLMFSLSEPGLRLPFMLLLTLGAGFLAQAMVLGPFVNILLFWIVYMMLNADTLENVGYGISAFVGNTTESSVPDAVFLPPEEAFVHILLWTGAVFVIALFAMIAANRLAGHDPLIMLRNGLIARLRAVAGLCAQECYAEAPEAQKVQNLAKQGTVELRRYHDLASQLHPELPRHRAGLAMIRSMTRLVMIAAAWTRLEGDGGTGLLKAVGKVAESCADVLQKRPGAYAALEMSDVDLQNYAAAMRGDPARHPLGVELARTLTVIRALLLKPDAARHGFVADVTAQAKGWFKPDAFRNPAYVQAAIKLALAVCICYGITRFTQWSGISTCVVTCFLVSLGTVGDSVHKMTLRLVGALIGAAAGIGTILWLMPYLTDLTDLILVVLPVTLLAGWIKSGSERIAYAGVQTSMAYFLTVLQGYGPTLDMATGRDRVVGIILGNVVVYVIATTLWPVSVASVGRKHVVSALQVLGDLVVYRRHDRHVLVEAGQERLRESFGRAIAAVRSSVINEPLEAAHVNTRRRSRKVDARVVTEIQMLAIPVAIISDAAEEPSEAVFAHSSALKRWLEHFGQWITHGRDGRALIEALPTPPDLPLDPERGFWFGVLDERIRAILDELLPAEVLREEEHRVAPSVDAGASHA
ncbi:fusaric acid resistance protein [Neokomagataea thailandica NBRC 106555]|nr:fusaric acid resistance protein [Neokomagataea thailandica NBRC 106555]